MIYILVHLYAEEKQQTEIHRKGRYTASKTFSFSILSFNFPQGRNVCSFNKKNSQIFPLIKMLRQYFLVIKHFLDVRLLKFSVSLTGIGCHVIKNKHLLWTEHTPNTGDIKKMNQFSGLFFSRGIGAGVGHHPAEDLIAPGKRKESGLLYTIHEHVKYAGTCYKLSNHRLWMKWCM